jgi:hypothetical protein
VAWEKLVLRRNSEYKGCFQEVSKLVNEVTRPKLNPSRENATDIPNPNPCAIVPKIKFVTDISCGVCYHG